jgi:hypothetical protein
MTRPFHNPGRHRRLRDDRRHLDFRRTAQAALRAAPALLRAWLPHGRLVSKEWLALNPRRADRTPGSFKVNLRTGRWADFATGDGGGDLISLLAYLRGCDQAKAARAIVEELGR